MDRLTVDAADRPLVEAPGTSVVLNLPKPTAQDLRNWASSELLMRKFSAKGEFDESGRVAHHPCEIGLRAEITLSRSAFIRHVDYFPVPVIRVWITNLLGLQSSGGSPYRRDGQHYGHLS